MSVSCSQIRTLADMLGCTTEELLNRAYMDFVATGIKRGPERPPAIAEGTARARCRTTKFWCGARMARAG